MSSILIRFLPLFLLLFLIVADYSATSSSMLVSGFRYNRTYDISVDIQPFQTYLAQVPSMAISVKLRASCNSMLCSFYIFDRNNFEKFEESQGREGRPLVSKLAILANTMETLVVAPDASKRTFKSRYQGPLYIVIQNLGIGTTTVTGNVFYVIDFSGKTIAAVCGGVLLSGICCLFCYIGIPVMLMSWHRKKKSHSQIHFLHTGYNQMNGNGGGYTNTTSYGDKIYIQVPSPIGYGTMANGTTTPPTPPVIVTGNNGHQLHLQYPYQNVSPVQQSHYHYNNSGGHSTGYYSISSPSSPAPVQQQPRQI